MLVQMKSYYFLFRRNQCYIHRIYQTVVGYFLLWERHKLFKNSQNRDIARISKYFFSVYLETCNAFLSRYNGVWQFGLQYLGN
jgi:hypothetical protein